MDLPQIANVMFLDIASAFFDLGYIDTNQDIATKFDISTRTVSIYIKLLETKGLIFINFKLRALNLVGVRKKTQGCVDFDRGA
jgi:DNA-binding transcriptional regulator LsrR (DeoR family)